MKLCDFYVQAKISPSLTFKKCYGCSQLFSVRHGLSCRHVMLITERHNKVCGKFLYFAQQAFSSNCLRNKPLINHVCSISEKEVHNERVCLETRGDFLISGLWESYTDTIIDVRLADLNCETYKKDPTKALLYFWGK